MDKRQFKNFTVVGTFFKINLNELQNLFKLNYVLVASQLRHAIDLSANMLSASKPLQIFWCHDWKMNWLAIKAHSCRAGVFSKFCLQRQHIVSEGVQPPGFHTLRKRKLSHLTSRVLH